MPFFDLNLAQNWEEFRRAWRASAIPPRNVVYADVDGHIGYQAAGMVPLRASGDGALPVPGNDNAHEWTSYLPFEQLPSVFDPPSGIIATANGRITPDGSTQMLSDESGTALPHGTHLPGAGSGQEVHLRRHAGAPERC